MKTKQLYKITDHNKSTKYLYTVIMLLAVSPFVYLLFLYMQSLQSNQSIMHLLNTDGLMCINLIASFCNLFAAYILKNSFDKKYSMDIVIVHLFIFAIAQVCVMNFFYFFLIGFVEYKFIQRNSVTIKSSFMSVMKNLGYVRIVGSLSILFIHIFLLFATLRIVL